MSSYLYYKGWIRGECLVSHFTLITIHTTYKRNATAQQSLLKILARRTSSSVAHGIETEIEQKIVPCKPKISLISRANSLSLSLSIIVAAAMPSFSVSVT